MNAINAIKEISSSFSWSTIVETAKQNKIITVACFAFACIAAFFAIRNCCCLKAKKTPPFKPYYDDFTPTPPIPPTFYTDFQPFPPKPYIPAADFFPTEGEEFPKTLLHLKEGSVVAERSGTHLKTIESRAADGTLYHLTSPAKTGSGAGISKELKKWFYTNKAYQSLGLNVPEMAVYHPNFKTRLDEEAIVNCESIHLLTKIPEGTLPVTSLPQIKTLKSHFIADCLLGNHDVAGFKYQHLRYHPITNEVWRIAGGVFALNDIKLLGEEVDIDAIRDPWINPDGANLFSTLSDDEIIHQIDVLWPKKANLISSFPFGPLRDIMAKRFDYLQIIKENLLFKKSMPKPIKPIVKPIETEIIPIISQPKKPLSKPPSPPAYDSDKYPSLKDEMNAVAAIQQKWLDDPSYEAKRLYNAGILPTDKMTYSYFDSSIEHQKYSVLGRVVELRNLYSNTHYVFTHGQGAHVSILNFIYKECVATFTPHFAHPLKVPFRIPHTVTYSENANNFTSTYKANEAGFTDNHNHSEKLISADGQFWNQDTAESAQYFFSNSTNITIGGAESLRDIFVNNFLNYIPCEKVCNLLATKAIKIADDRRKETSVGVIYAICVPKIIIQDDKTNFAYHCHPFGKVCNCHGDRVKILNEMQSGKKVMCKNGRHTQYRILAARLTEEKGVRTFAVSALTKSKQLEYDAKIKELVEELRLCSHLLAQYEDLESDPSNLDIIDIFNSTYPKIASDYGAILSNPKERKKKTPLPT